MKWINKVILVFVCLVFFVPFLCAKEIIDDRPISDETREICNKVIRNIYYDILTDKKRYRGLADFGEDALYENKQGILTIVYQFDTGKQTNSNLRRDKYAIAVTIEKMGEKLFQNQEGYFAYGFNVLGLKISGYQRKHLLRTQYDIIPLINKHGTLLADYQQKYLPLQIQMNATKGTFSVREDIYFDVILKNVSKRHMVVKRMNKDTVYFLINNEFWGTLPESGKHGGKSIVLKSGEEISARFKGESFQSSQEVEIRAIYRIAIDGVNPYTTLKIKIVK